MRSNPRVRAERPSASLPGALVASLLGARSTQSLDIRDKDPRTMNWNWKEIGLPALATLQSTEQLQPLHRDEWPQWARESPKFSGAWITPLDGSVAASTTHLSTSNVTASIDFERTSTSGAPLRYYRNVYVKMQDGRVFQAGPFKNLEYERHRDDRPSWLAAYTTASSS